MSVSIEPNFIDGERVPSGGEQSIAVADPTTEQVIGAVGRSPATDVDAAVRAAGAAFPGWAETSRRQRAAVLKRLLDALTDRTDDIARTITSDVGTPIRVATRIQAALPLTDISGYLELLEAGWDDELVGNSLVVREPVGVVAAVTPWNYPLHQITAKLAPALAAGATVVLKPSEVAPLVVGHLVAALEEAGVPPGVVNVVHGTGDGAGEALVAHPGVDMVSFTGSVPAGRRVAGLAAQTIKKVTLELGGKSANVLLDDADLETAVKVGVANAFLNAGQTCTAWTRMLVPVDRQDEVVDLARNAAERFVPGDPSDPGTRLGPLVSAAQRDRVRAHIRTGIADGARLVTGGAEPPPGCPTGYFVAPTVFAGVDPRSTIAQEEIFGPVLSIIPCRDEDEALTVANDSDYGLHGAVWSADRDRAVAFARRIRTGQVDVNGAAYNPRAPFGGYKRSGIGRELGRQGLEEFQETKSIQL
ncbi:aldehyde dehydrogenase family protein [Pseudonocardia kongjuensis]|uniref:aldehyde dehydrogenase (NAD(+)) n=1 Tax=Pseudonocardia kongjuensis TaxID=102227 RepID=A0ABN1XP02_9PSEU